MPTLLPRLICVPALLVVAACGGGEIVNEAPPPPPVVMVPEAEAVAVREDFDNRHHIDSVSGAVIDTNRGLATLPAHHFPESSDTTANATLKGPNSVNGLVEGFEVWIEPEAVVDADDALEIRADKSVTIDGTIRAGEGGVTLVAKEQIILRGVIDSRGPIRILTESPESEIIIAGAITTRALNDGAAPPHIEIWGRGRLHVGGRVETFAEEGMSGGTIDLRVYEAVHLAAGAALTSSGPGRSGIVRVRSERSILLDARAVVGALSDADDASTQYGLSVELQAPEIEIEDQVDISAGAGDETGGDVLIVASGELVMGDFVSIASGQGLQGGNLTLRAGSIVLGSNTSLIGGRSQDLPGLVRVEASERLDAAFSARIQGSNTDCGPGGDVRIEVGGRLTVNDRSHFIGGDARHSVADCSRLDEGGSVFITAQDTDPLKETIVPGFPGGESNVVIDPDFSLARPDPIVGTDGEIRSVVFDRGAEAIGFVPVMLLRDELAPPRTSIAIEVAGAPSSAGPFTPWIEAASDPESLADLADMQYLRYRVRLRGRVFDAPTLDRFELLLFGP